MDVEAGKKPRWKVGAWRLSVAALAVAVLLIVRLVRTSGDRYAFLDQFGPQRVDRRVMGRGAGFSESYALIFPSRVTPQILPELMRRLSPERGYTLSRSPLTASFSRNDGEIVSYSESYSDIYQDTGLSGFPNDTTGCSVEILHRKSLVERIVEGLKQTLHLN